MSVNNLPKTFSEETIEINGNILDVDLMRRLVKSGLTEEQIANVLDISTAALNSWINKNEDLRKIMDEGRNFVDSQVEKSLFQSAMGIKNNEGDGYLIPPNVRAQIYWLKCRKPEQWSDKTDVVVHQDIKIKVPELPDKLKERLLNDPPIDIKPVIKKIKEDDETS